VFGPMAIVMLPMGPRMGEAVALTRQDVFEDRILVRHTWNRLKKGRVLPKSGSSRTLRMPEGLYALISERWSQFPDSIVALPSANGTVFIARNFARFLNQACSRVPHVPRVTAHDLRRIAATRWAENPDVTVKEIQDDLGHVTPNLAMSVYVLSSGNGRRVAPSRLTDVLPGVAPWEGAPVSDEQT
jgi:integrase